MYYWQHESISNRWSLERIGKKDSRETRQEVKFFHVNSKQDNKRTGSDKKKRERANV